MESPETQLTTRISQAFPRDVDLEEGFRDDPSSLARKLCCLYEKDQLPALRIILLAFYEEPENDLWFFQEYFLAPGMRYSRPGHGLRDLEKINGRSMNALVRNLTSAQLEAFIDWQRWAIEDAVLREPEDLVLERQEILAWLESFRS